MIDGESDNEIEPSYYVSWLGDESLWATRMWTTFIEREPRLLVHIYRKYWEFMVKADFAYPFPFLFSDVYNNTSFLI